MHSIARTPKILTFMSWTGKCRQQKHTQHAPSTKTECDYLNGHICKDLTPNGEPQRYRWGTQKKKEKKKKKKKKKKKQCKVNYLKRTSTYSGPCVNARRSFNKQSMVLSPFFISSLHAASVCNHCKELYLAWQTEQKAKIGTYVKHTAMAMMMIIPGVTDRAKGKDWNLCQAHSHGDDDDNRLIPDITE